MQLYIHKAVVEPKFNLEGEQFSKALLTIDFIIGDNFFLYVLCKAYLYHLSVKT